MVVASKGYGGNWAWNTHEPPTGKAAVAETPAAGCPGRTRCLSVVIPAVRRGTPGHGSTRDPPVQASPFDFGRAVVRRAGASSGRCPPTTPVPGARGPRRGDHQGQAHPRP